MKLFDRIIRPLIEPYLEPYVEPYKYRLNYVRQTVDPRREAEGGYGLKIVCLDVNHGDATLILFPSGRVALVDSAKDVWCRRRVIPFLEHHNIGEITYYINTHLHEDHVGQKERILRDYLVQESWDYRTFHTGEERELEGVQLTILNSYEDATDENDRSLAFRLEYNGFTYTHGADLYADGQERIMVRFPELVRTHVYRANHHLHGSVSQEHLIQADPCLVIISAQEAVYERIAYTRDFKRAVERIKENQGRLRDVCLTLERGNIVVFANGAQDWGYATYAPQIILAGLYP